MNILLVVAPLNLFSVIFAFTILDWCMFNISNFVWNADWPISKNFRRILKAEPPMPREFSPEVKDFIRRLLTKNPVNRLGAKSAEEVKKHKFFKVTLACYIRNVFKTEFKISLLFKSILKCTLRYHKY